MKRKQVMIALDDDNNDELESIDQSPIKSQEYIDISD